MVAMAMCFVSHHAATACQSRRSRGAALPPTHRYQELSSDPVEFSSHPLCFFLVIARSSSYGNNGREKSRAAARRRQRGRTATRMGEENDGLLQFKTSIRSCKRVFMLWKSTVLKLHRRMHRSKKSFWRQVCKLKEDDLIFEGGLNQDSILALRGGEEKCDL